MFPPSFISKIKKLVAKLKLHINFNISNIRLIHIDVHNTTHNAGTNLYLNPKDIPSAGFAELMASAVDAERIPVIKSDTKHVLQRIEHIVLIDKETLSKLKPILELSDFNAVEASLIIRGLFKEGIQIDRFKLSLIQRFGDRGRKICDIVSAGYLEKEIMPLFDRLIDIDNGPQIFKAQFERIVANEAFAIFVRTSLGRDQLMRQVREKLRYHKRIGVYYVNLHAIGKHNVQKVQSVVKSLVSDNEVAIIEFDENPRVNPFVVFARLGCVD